MGNFKGFLVAPVRGAPAPKVQEVCLEVVRGERNVQSVSMQARLQVKPAPELQWYTVSLTLPLAEPMEVFPEPWALSVKADNEIYNRSDPAAFFGWV